MNNELACSLAIEVFLNTILSATFQNTVKVENFNKPTIMLKLNYAFCPTL